MQFIPDAQIESMLDFDYGEGWLTFSWLDENRIHGALAIDIDGHCHREMPIRSGMGVEIVAVHRDRVHLRFADQLAAKLELDQEIEFAGDISEDACADLRRMAHYL